MRVTASMNQLMYDAHSFLTHATIPGVGATPVSCDFWWPSRWFDVARTSKQDGL